MRYWRKIGGGKLVFGQLVTPGEKFVDALELPGMKLVDGIVPGVGATGWPGAGVTGDVVGGIVPGGANGEVPGAGVAGADPAGAVGAAAVPAQTDSLAAPRHTTRAAPAIVVIQCVFINPLQFLPFLSACPVPPPPAMKTAASSAKCSTSSAKSGFLRQCARSVFCEAMQLSISATITPLGGRGISLAELSIPGGRAV